MTKWRVAQYLVVALLVAFAFVELSRAAHDLTELSPFRRILEYWWLAGALSLQMLQYLSDGYFTRRLLRLMQFHVSLKDTVRIAALDVFGATFLPLGQLGSMAAAFYFYQRRGLPSQAIVFLNVAVALITAGVLAVLFVTSLLVLPAGTFPVRVSLRTWMTLATVLLAGIAGLAALIVSGRLVLKSRLLRATWYERLRRTAVDCRALFSALSKRRFDFVGSVAAKDIAYYAIDVASIQCCFLALHVAPPLALVATAYVVSLVLGYVAMTPAGLGATDATLTLILLAGRVAPSPVVGMLLLYRLINVVLPAPIGAWCFFTLRRESLAQSR